MASKRTVFPASFAQRLMWVNTLLDAASAFYNVALLVELRGPLDVEAMRTAVARFVERHEVFRTTLRIESTELVQVIWPTADVPIALIDVSGEAPEARDAAWRRIAHEQARLPSISSADRSRGRR